jgi:hypothetical protein
MKAPTDTATSFPRVLVALMKGVLWRDDDERRWSNLLSLQARVRDHVAPLGLALEIDEADGYAFLRQRPQEPGEESFPRLVPRRPLGFAVSLLLVLLRKKVAESDAGGGDRRVVLRKEDLVDLVRQFLPTTTNEAKLVDQIGAHLNKVVELGFLRPLRGRDEEYEVVRLIKAFVDAEWLERLLAVYRELAEASGADPEGAGEAGR